MTDIAVMKKSEREVTWLKLQPNCRWGRNKRGLIVRPSGGRSRARGGKSIACSRISSWAPGARRSGAENGVLTVTLPRSTTPESCRVVFVAFVCRQQSPQSRVLSVRNAERGARQAVGGRLFADARRPL